MNMTNQKNNQSIRTSEDHDHEPARQARSRSDHCSLLSSYSFPRENATKVTCLLCALPSLVSARPFKKKNQGSGHKPPSIGITRAWQNLLGGDLPEPQDTPGPSTDHVQGLSALAFQAAACTGPLCSLGQGSLERNQTNNKKLYKK